MGILTASRPSQSDPADIHARFREEAWPLLPAMMRVAWSLTGDRHSAEDLVQEAMMKAFRSFDTYTAGTNPKAWLLTILRRLHIDRHRAATRRIDAASLDVLEHDPADRNHRETQAAREAEVATWHQPDDLLARFDDDDIAAALQAVPEKLRWTLLLVDVEQMSMDEAAATLDVPTGTVKSRLSRARAQLRDTLAPQAIARGWTPPSHGDA